MSISQTTITGILDENDVPQLLRTDPELLAAAYNIARLQDPPAEGPEARFLAASTLLPGDLPGEEYWMDNHALLKEIYDSQLRNRVWELERELLDAAHKLLTAGTPGLNTHRPD